MDKLSYHRHCYPPAWGDRAEGVGEKGVSARL